MIFPVQCALPPLAPQSCEVHMHHHSPSIVPPFRCVLLTVLPLCVFHLLPCEAGFIPPSHTTSAQPIQGPRHLTETSPSPPSRPPSFLVIPHDVRTARGSIILSGPPPFQGRPRDGAVSSIKGGNLHFCFHHVRIHQGLPCR